MNIDLIPPTRTVSLNVPSDFSEKPNVNLSEEYASIFYKESGGATREILGRIATSCTGSRGGTRVLEWKAPWAKWFVAAR